MDWQVDCVHEAAGDLLERHAGITKAVLCFIGVELTLTIQPQVVGPNDVAMTWPRRFVKDIDRSGPLSRAQIDEVAHRLAERLPAAVPSP